MGKLIEQLISKHCDRISMRNYLRGLDIIDYIGGLGLAPIKIAKTLNIMEYRRHIARDDGSLIVSDEWRAKHRFPNILSRYRYWAMITRIFTNVDASAMMSPYTSRCHQFNELAKIYRGEYSSKLEAAILAILGYNECVDTLTNNPIYIDTPLSYGLVISGINWRYPNIEVLRLLYLTEEITYPRYIAMFEDARDRDSNLVPMTTGAIFGKTEDGDTYVDAITSAYIIADSGEDDPICRTDSKIWNKYDELFGSQYKRAVL